MAVDGIYNIEVQSPMGTQPSTLTLKSDGGTLSGTMSGQMGVQSFEDGTVNRDDFSYSVKIQSPMGEVQLTFTGTVDGDAVSGQAQAGSFGAFPFKGTRS
ncbi:MAG: hypothetical protein JW712_07185 [Dehalococcoidales bacterium]|nr:hypothetical protein [Dehalococcoidales bacterium]